MNLLKRGAEDHLRAKFGGATGERWIEATAEGWLWLDQGTMTRHGLAQADVEAQLAGWLREQRGIQTAITRTELLAGKGDDPVFRHVLRSFYPARSGDVVVIPRPYSILWTLPTGTMHGTPHPYDTHVPLLVAGCNVRAARRRDLVSPLATAVILSRALGIRPPTKAEVALPEGLLVQLGAEAPSPSGAVRDKPALAR
jgi:hypothetical protein